MTSDRITSSGGRRSDCLCSTSETAWSASGDARTDLCAVIKSSSSNIGWAQQLCYWFAASPVRSAITCLLLFPYHITVFYSSVLADQQTWYNQDILCQEIIHCSLTVSYQTCLRVVFNIFSSSAPYCRCFLLFSVSFHKGFTQQ